MHSTLRTYKIITVILFGLLLLLPMLQLIFHIVPEKATESENRALNECPQLKFNQLDKFPTAFDNYISDHFPFRRNFLDIYFQYAILNHESPIPSVIIGKDNFLFSGKEELDLYKGTANYFSEEDMDIVIQELSEREQRLRKEGITFLVAIAPTSLEIHPEYLPKYIQRAQHTATEIFLKKLQKQAPNVSCLYLRETLQRHKDSTLLYLKNDNHWNSLGAYYGANDILNKLSEKHPELPQCIEKQFKIEPYTSEEGNLAGWLSVGGHPQKTWKSTNYHVSFFDTSHVTITENTEQDYPPTPGFAYPWEYEKEFQTNREEAPKIVVIRDSYSSALIPYLAPYFRHSLFIFDAWQYGENWNIIQNEQPDIVMLVIYEPHIRNIARR